MFNTNIENPNSLCYIGQDSYQSGKLAARLLGFSLPKKSTILILNLTRGSKNANHLLVKSQGFKDYYKNDSSKEIIIEEFAGFKSPTKMKNYFKKLEKKYPNLSGIFFTNSRAYFAVKVLSEDFLKKIKIVGFDLLEQNIKYLLDDKINFLINQNPLEQGYLGITNLYHHLVLKQPVRKIQFLPLDIVIKENLKYYLDREKFTNIV